MVPPIRLLLELMLAFEQRTIALLPFSIPISSDIDTLGGMLTTICTWSFIALSSSISAHFNSHIARIFSSIAFAIPPSRIRYLYFGVHKIW